MCGDKKVGKGDREREGAGSPPGDIGWRAEMA